jgi:hypothetical protein
MTMPPNPSGKFTVHAGQAARFLALLDPQALAFNFSWYPEKGTNTPLPPQLAALDSTYRTAAFDDQFAYLLGVLNGHQRAIYCCMNVLGRKNGSDARTDDNVTKVRAVIADFDEGLPRKPLPLKPTCLVHTSNDIETGQPRYQAFWRVKGVSLEEFDAIEARLVADWGADPNSVNRSRIQRLPGYWHQKHEKPHLVVIVEENDVTYTRKQLVKAFPPIFDRARSSNDQRTMSSSTSAKAQALVRKPTRATQGNGDGDEKKEVDKDALRSALAHLAGIPHPDAKASRTYSDDYDTWVRFGLAIKRGLGEEGFELWIEFSSTSSRYPGEDESRAKWDRGFDVDGRSGDKALTVGTIFHCAKRHGWSFTEFHVARTLERARAARARERAAKSHQP